ncbi:MAG: exonuclease SbcCD subunit D [Clostridiales bacterium]|nr:exonuclease SbcCD subunit D [Clostridiales bacterium]
MRILHTADWHIGAKTDDLDRFNEQKDALKQVVEHAKNYNVDMVLIAGDIYNNIVPSAEDEELFYKTVVELSRNGECAVVAIAGNHDDPKRLSNANIFADKFGIYLVGNIDNISIDNSRQGTNIWATRSGKGFIEFETSKGEKCVLALLPYPSYYRYNEIKREGQSFQDKVEEWLKPGVSQFRDDTINITMAHVMSFGVGLTQDEVLNYTNLSTTFNFVDQKLFHNKSHYTALGHIHQATAVNKERNIFYSGALINQFFSINNDSPTNVIIADIDNTGVQNIIRQPLNVKLLKKFTVNSVSSAHKMLDNNPDDLIKIVIENVDNIDAEVDNSEYTPYVTPSDLKNLRQRHPNLVTLSVITNEAKASSEIISKKDLTNAEIFEHFVKSRTGAEPDDDIKELFLSLMSEGLYEAD